MSRSARYLTWPLALLVSLQASRADADVQDGVDQDQSGDARVTVEWFAPAARGKFPAILLLHGSGGLDPGTAQVFRAIGRDFVERGHVVFIPPTISNAQITPSASRSGSRNSRRSWWRST